MFRFLRPLCLVAAVALMTCGCSNSKAPPEPETSPLPDEPAINEKLVHLPFEQQTAAGAVTDRTIYAHHFIGDSALLNTLGEQRIDALLDVATDRPMKVNVLDTGEPTDLHEARVAAVRERLLASGIEESRLQIVSGPPGGPGIPSGLIVKTLQAERAAKEQGAGMTGGSSTGSISSELGGGRR